MLSPVCPTCGAHIEAPQGAASTSRSRRPDPSHPGHPRVREAIISLAGLIGRPVRNQAGQEIGRLVDVVARWSDDQTYPPVTGLVVRVGRRLAFVDASAIDTWNTPRSLLQSARLDLRGLRPVALER